MFCTVLYTISPGFLHQEGDPSPMCSPASLLEFLELEEVAGAPCQLLGPRRALGSFGQQSIWERQRCRLWVAGSLLMAYVGTCPNKRPSLALLISTAAQTCWWRKGPCHKPKASWPFSKACPHQGKGQGTPSIPGRLPGPSLATLSMGTETLRTLSPPPPPVLHLCHSSEHFSICASILQRSAAGGKSRCQMELSQTHVGTCTLCRVSGRIRTACHGALNRASDIVWGWASLAGGVFELSPGEQL